MLNNLQVNGRKLRERIDNWDLGKGKRKRKLDFTLEGWVGLTGETAGDGYSRPKRYKQESGGRNTLLSRRIKNDHQNSMLLAEK